MNREKLSDAGTDAYRKDQLLLCSELKSNPENGLSTGDAQLRLNNYGPNVITGKKPVSPVIVFLAQFKGPFVVLLFFAAGLSSWFREWLDAIAILVVIIINGIIGFLMEFKAERSMDALKRLTKMKARVIRNGNTVEVPSEDLVPGDILLAEGGDMILADARIIQSSQLSVDESPLTGESLAVDKQNNPIPGESTLAERSNMLYKGTYVTRGNVKAVVIQTGMQTELGQIAALVESAVQVATPLEKKIAQFSRKILWLTVGLIVLIFIVGVIDGDNVLSMLQTSIALAVAAIPEGLPIVTTLALAQGMLRMSKRNVIIRKLAAVETLGGTNVICTDKTGTLTQNRIEVDLILHADREVMGDSGKSREELVHRISILCNTAELLLENGELKEIGDPLETGLLKYAQRKGADIANTRKIFRKIAEEPFSSETKIMATLHHDGEKYFIAAKGAVEELLECCTTTTRAGKIVPLNNEERAFWLNEAEKNAQAGLRMIAVAYRESETAAEKLSTDLTFAGLIGLVDPPRAEVHHAIRECHSAGINVIMITGDHPATAKNIALQLELVRPGEEQVIHGKEMGEFDSLDDAEKNRWMNTKIFARVTPKQKLDLVSVLQEKNMVVGMTGDGVNDAPALKKADIGIAMGQRGTQVAQEVADMVLKDDSFSSIVSAIKQGRVIFENIRKFVMYLLSCNLSELFIISFSSVMNLHYALFPLQILYINLVTDVLPALALGVTEGSYSIMKQPPRDPSEPIIDRKRWISIIVYAIVMTACCLSAVLVSHLTMHDTEHWNPELCNNVLFITLILSQLWNVFNMTMDNSVSFFRTDVSRNKYVWLAIVACLVLTLSAYIAPPVEKALSLYHPSMMDLSVMFGFSLLSFVLIRLLKRIKLIL